MNGLVFNESFKSIIGTLNEIEYSLEFERSFFLSSRKDFNQVLLEIPSLLANLQCSSKETLENRVALIVLFGKIEAKIISIKGLIYPVTKKEYSFRQIDGTLPLLQDRIRLLAADLTCSHRLPFEVDEPLKKYYAKVEQEVCGKTVSFSQANVKVTDVFHLVADKLNKEDVDEIQPSRLEGSFELHATLSYSHILRQLLLVPGVRKEAVQFLLDQVNGAKEIALKTTYISMMEENNSPDALQAYFSNLLKLLYDNNSSTLKQFNASHQLSLNNCSVPAAVVLADVCHDLVEMVAQIQSGDKRIFCIGTAHHQVLIQMERVEKDEWIYTIINTGDGSEIDQIEEGDLDAFARPRVYRGLNRGVFTYHFFEKLLSHNYDQKATVEDFYAFHFTKLIEEANGYFDDERASLVKLQNFGICTYAVLDVWIDSYLNQAEIIEKERIKVDIALNKQAKAVEIMRETVAKKKSLKMPNQSKRIKQAPSLLTQGLQLKALCEIYQEDLNSMDVV